MNSILYQAMVAHLNKDPREDELFHQFVVSRSSQIHESIRTGKEFVLEDLEAPTLPDLDLTEAELLIDTPDGDDDSDDDHSPVDTGVDFDGDGDVDQDDAVGAIRADIENTEDHLEAVLAQLEALFDEDDEEGIKESVELTRTPDGTVSLRMDDPVEDTDDVAPVDATVKPTEQPTEQDTTSTADVDASDADDMQFESVKPKKRVVEGRKVSRTFGRK